MTRTNLGRTSFRGLALRTLMLALASLGAQCHQAGGQETQLNVWWTCPGLLDRDGFPFADPLPSLFGVWGADGSEVIAVGDVGTVFRYDGSGWRESQIQRACPDPPCVPGWENFSLFSHVWGSSRSDVFVVADRTLLHFDGTNWLELQYYTVIDLEGRRRRPLYDFFHPLALNAVWGSSASDVFAVGDGTIIHYDGASWRSMLLPESGRLNSVWGGSANFVYAVGDHIALLYDGFQWTHLTSGTTQDLRRVWGSSADDVFAVGHAGTIVHWDQRIWQLMESGTHEDLSGVWGSSGNDVFAVGANGTILHFDGSSWSAQISGVTVNLKGVWGTSASDVFAVGQSGAILHYDGSSWSVQSLRVRIAVTRSSAAPDERIVPCSVKYPHNVTTFRYRIARSEAWTVNGELLGYSGLIAARDSQVVSVDPGGGDRVELNFNPSAPPSSGTVVLRWSLNGSQPSDDLYTLCRNYGADRVVATVNGGNPASESCYVGSLPFPSLSGTVTLHARLVNQAGVDVALPRDVTVQVVPGAAIDAHVDFQVNFPCQATGTRHGTADITASENWTAAAGPHHVATSLTVKNGAVLTVWPGATVCLGQFVALNFQEGAQLVAGAGGGDPVTFTGDYQGASNPPAAWRWISLSGPPTGSHSAITNAIIEYAADAAVITDYAHPVLIDATMIRHSGKVFLRAPGSQMTNSTVDGTGVVLGGSGSGSISFQSRVKNAPGPAAIAIFDSNVNVALSNCEIIGSAQDGVSVAATATSNVTVNGCNLVSNSGLAINNATGTTVTADNDWWDPPGNGNPPTMTPPNGVSANVTVTNVRSSPVMLNY